MMVGWPRPPLSAGLCSGSAPACFIPPSGLLCESWAPSHRYGKFTNQDLPLCDTEVLEVPPAGNMALMRTVARGSQSTQQGSDGAERRPHCPPQPMPCRIGTGTVPGLRGMTRSGLGQGHHGRRRLSRHIHLKHTVGLL